MSVQFTESGSDVQNENASDKISSASLEIMVINCEDKEALDNDCLICMEAIEVKQEVVKLTCLHYYHHKCISKWLTKKSSCPICRQPVSDNPFLESFDSLPTEGDLQIDFDRSVQFVLRGVPEEDLIDAIDEYERVIRQYIYNDSDSDLLSEDES